MRVSLSVFEGSSAFFGKDGYVVRPTSLCVKHDISFWTIDFFFSHLEAEVGEGVAGVSNLPSWAHVDIYSAPLT